MVRKAFRTGNSIVISLPRDAIEYLNIHEGVEVEVSLDRDNHQVIVKPIEKPAIYTVIDKKFAHQVDEFIEHYRPALEKLAK